MVGELVILQNCAYSGCLGAVVAAVSEQKGHKRSYEVELPGFGTVVRCGSDIRPVSADDVESGVVVLQSPQQWLLRTEIKVAGVGMYAAIDNGNVAYAEQCATRIAAAEAQLERIGL